MVDADKFNEIADAVQKLPDQTSESYKGKGGEAHVTDNGDFLGIRNSDPHGPTIDINFGKPDVGRIHIFPDQVITVQPPPADASPAQADDVPESEDPSGDD